MTANGRPGRARVVIKALGIGAVVSMIVGASLPIGLTAAVAASGASRSRANVLTSHKGPMGWQLVVKLGGEKLSLYSSLSDRRGKSGYQSAKSRCYDRCTKTWLPLIDRGHVRVANRSCRVSACRINPKRLGTIKRKGGSLQVTYYGHPLYRYRKDTKTGQVQGQGNSHNWAAITPGGGLYCKGTALCPC